jgi:hypothetical protein
MALHRKADRLSLLLHVECDTQARTIYGGHGRYLDTYMNPYPGAAAAGNRVRPEGSPRALQATTSRATAASATRTATTGSRAAWMM